MNLAAVRRAYCRRIVMNVLLIIILIIVTTKKMTLIMRTIERHPATNNIDKKVKEHQAQSL